MNLRVDEFAWSLREMLKQIIEGIQHFRASSDHQIEIQSDSVLFIHSQQPDQQPTILTNL